MSILVVADEFPWPPVNGSRIRLATQLDGLLSVGSVELFCISDPPDPDDRAVPADVHLARASIVDRARIERSPATLARWVRSDLPRELQWRDWTLARELLRQWVRGPYDLVWFSDIAAYRALHDLVEGPVVVDYDDLESWKLAHRRRLGAERLDTAGRWRAILAAQADQVDEARWRRVEADVAARVDRVLVCSDLDRVRLGAANAAVLPNGYPAPADPASRAPSSPPTLVFIGLQTYPPNIDAARLLADHVLPLVQQHVPDAGLRLIGQHGPEVRALARRHGVEVVGPVVDVAPELARASVTVIPIRFGGGTRVKILEAFAHRVPVVTTGVGCEGIDVRPGVELLLAEDPPSMADAVVRLLTDQSLTERVVAAAAALFDRRYRAEQIQRQTAEVAAEAIGRRP